MRHRDVFVMRFDGRSIVSKMRRVAWYFDEKEFFLLVHLLHAVPDLFDEVQISHWESSVNIDFRVDRIWLSFGIEKNRKSVKEVASHAIHEFRWAGKQWTGTTSS